MSFSIIVTNILQLFLGSLVMSMASELNPVGRFLMGPGPSDVHPQVLGNLGLPGV